jgi:hypothetical protein
MHGGLVRAAHRIVLGEQACVAKGYLPYEVPNSVWFLRTLRYRSQVSDSNLIARRVGPIHGMLVASRDYIREHGAPETPDELARKAARRANHSTSFTLELSTPSAKNISLNPVGQISATIRPSHPTRGACARHERAVGCGGRGCADDERHVRRTAKSCGSGAPMLASSS